MNIYVVVGVYLGVVDQVKATIDPKIAAGHIKALKKQYGIRRGHEGESNHTVSLLVPELETPKGQLTVIQC